MNVQSWILVVDDDIRIRRIVRDALVPEGFEVLGASNGLDAIQVLNSSQVELVLLDLGLPDVDGMFLAKKIWQNWDVPIVMLTGRGDILDRVNGLDIGAEDYITKPFHILELVARVKTVLRRNSISHKRNRRAMGDLPVKLAKFHDWMLDFAASELTSPIGSKVFLTAHEFRMLAALVTRPNENISRDEFAEMLSERSRQPLGRSIDVRIGKLRKKLNDDHAKPSFIQTIRGLGYKFVASVEYEPTSHDEAGGNLRGWK